MKSWIPKVPFQTLFDSSILQAHRGFIKSEACMSGSREQNFELTYEGNYKDSHLQKYESISSLNKV